MSSIPRTCGDEPLAVLAGPISNEYSPHVRG